MPPELATGPPDFVGVGTHLGGSRWWARLLAAHPDISGPAGGDWSLGFFEPFCAREMGEDDVAAYHAHFPRRPGAVVGEWSDRYALDPWTPPLLRRAAPDAKLLLVLRDPVERYRRQLSRRMGDPRPAGEPIYMSEDVHRGRYASQLRVLRAFFDPERILVLQWERCLRDPRGEYARTLRFLGVDDRFAPRRLRPSRLAEEVAPRVRRRLGLPAPAPVGLWPDIAATLRTEMTPEVEELRVLVPALDLGLWPAFAHLAPRDDTAP